MKVQDTKSDLVRNKIEKATWDESKKGGAVPEKSGISSVGSKELTKGFESGNDMKLVIQSLFMC